ncbi:ribosome silencing factor [Agarilytica rhodophyticola]|uniref:ribosome silencing factor n=1 Tax=Agarilytica rhodophyticola TaxID=1737490 RepID=UPI000B3453CE|nr:ribosome silencing factor [Agarilytica rhodophyticola]
MSENLNEIIKNAIEDSKGQDVTELDVTELSDVMDCLVIVTGTSSRHVKSLAQNIVEDTKKAGIQAIGVEGMEDGEWTLVDFGDTVVHVMQQSTRDFYELEKLWTMEPPSRKNNS